MFAPAIADKAGRGALCSKIEQLTKAILRHSPTGEKPDEYEMRLLMRRLDQARDEFRKLYGVKETANEPVSS